MTKKYQGITLGGAAVELTVDGGIIRRVGAVAATPELPRLLPVLVDLQHNGALGHAYNNITSDDAEALRRIAGHLLRHGVGRVLATFTTTDYPRLERAAAALRGHFDTDAELNALFPGIFHEGVFISPDGGWRGGHDPEFIRDPDWERFCRLNDLTGNRVRVVNVAPERPGALDFIAKAAESGIRVALGHCHPESEVTHEAVRAGASMVTHFANGAAPEIHRFHNPFWGFLDDPGLSLGLVGDGFHLPPEVVRAVHHRRRSGLPLEQRERQARLRRNQRGVRLRAELLQGGERRQGPVLQSVRRRPMKKFDYEIPELAEANFGKFVQGTSTPGQAGDNDQGTEKL